MEVLVKYGTPEQQERWLKPLLQGRIRSAFCMTEPGVASSDATNMQATAVEDGNEVVLNGRKWWSTGIGHPDCQVLVFMGLSLPDAPKHARHSMVLVPIDAPGVKIERMLTVFGKLDEPYGHGEVSFTNVRMPKENVILGGAARRITLESALRRMEDEVDHVVIQDVCRPFVTPAMISAVLAAAGKSGCAVTGEPVRDPLRQVSKKGLIEGGDPEGDLWLVQSPQAYRRSLLEKALAAAQKKKLAEPEESALMPLVKAGVQMVAAERRNPRLRDATDLAIASQFLP